MRLLAAALAVIASLLLYVSPARAQITIGVANETSPPRLDRNGNTVQQRDRNLNPDAVNFQDCVDDQKIRFTLQLGGTLVGDSIIQVWASNSGVDCGVNTNRSGNAQQCWTVSDNVPLQQMPAFLPGKECLIQRVK